jgi:hypothetical protein
VVCSLGGPMSGSGHVMLGFLPDRLPVSRIRNATGRLWSLRAHAAVAAVGLILISATAPGHAGAQPPTAAADTALVISIDVSSSVNERRFNLQLEGIASALEDSSVINSVLSGPNGTILISVVSWADQPTLAVPWTVIGSIEDATALASRIRRLTQQNGEFTCMGRMTAYILDKVLVRLPSKAIKTVIDVSGDGPENCNSESLLRASRESLINAGVTINGLPILEGPTGEGLEDWYRQNVIGGPSAFLMPAAGYDDFARAFRQKFLIEMSLLPFSEPSDRSVAWHQKESPLQGSRQ